MVVSEQQHLTGETNESSATTTVAVGFTRQTLTVYPAAGCDVDNLNTSPVQREELQLLELVAGTEQKIHAVVANNNNNNNNNRTTSGGPPLLATTATIASMVTVLAPPSSTTTTTSSQRTNNNGPSQQERLRMEACFAWLPPPPPLPPQSVGVESVLDASTYRTRVQIEAMVCCRDQKPLTLVSPIRVSLERQITASSSGGNDRGGGGGLAAEQCASGGGGLDGRTVSQWLGPVLSKKDMQSFAAQDMSSQQWIVSSDEWDTARHDAPGATTVPFMILPGNVTVGSWTATAAVDESGDHAPRSIVEIGRIDPTTSSRHVVQFTLPISSGSMNTALPSVISRIEHGRLESC
jgi:hypothetical protein